MASNNPIVIIGSGQAGVSLARELRKANPEQAITVVSADQGGFYSKPMLSNAFIKKLPLERLVMQDSNVLAEKTQIQTIAHAQVTKVDTATQIIHLEQTLDAGQVELKTLAYDKLVLAVGAEPFAPAIPGIENAVAINHINDYNNFRAKLDAAGDKARIAIIGGGLVGCELANDIYFAEHQITLIERENQLLPRLISANLSEALEREFKALGFDVKTETAVESITEVAQDDKTIYQIKTGSELIEADLVISALGLRPRLELANSIGLKTNKGIICNTQLQTSEANIYALGDCVEVEGLVLPYILPIMEGARVLAQVLTGKEAALKYPCMPVAVKTSSFPMVVCPPLDAQHPELTVKEEIITDEEPAVRTFYYRGEQLVGFCLAGAATKERQALATQTLGYLDQVKL